MASTTLPAFWLYRVGRNQIDHFGYRFVFSETFISWDAPVSDAITINQLRSIAAHYSGTSFDHPAWSLNLSPPFAQELWPNPRNLIPLLTTRQVGGATLNPHAREAAFRLQRVGAGSPAVRGRVCFPIFRDQDFADLPYRRHISQYIPLPVFANGSGFWDHQQPTFIGRTYQNVIVDRRGPSFIYVDHYELLRNPVRIWQRNRPYVKHTGDVDDSVWFPDEFHP